MSDDKKPAEIADEDLDATGAGTTSLSTFEEMKPRVSTAFDRTMGIRKAGIRVPGVRVPGVRVPLTKTRG